MALVLVKEFRGSKSFYDAVAVGIDSSLNSTSLGRDIPRGCLLNPRRANAADTVACVY